jgi:hypothetical protein
MTEAKQPDETNKTAGPYSVGKPPSENNDLAFLADIESIDDNNSSIRPLGYEELQAKTITSLRLIGNDCFYKYRDANFKCNTKKISGSCKKQLVERLVAFFYQLHLQRHGSVAAPRPVANSNKFHDCKIARLLERWIQQ